MGPRVNSGPRSGRVLQKRERNEKIFAMRISGASFSQIGAHFGISKKRVIQLIDEEYARREPQYAESVERLRNMAVERLDRLALVHWQQYQDPASAAILLRIEERRSMLLGTDAPTESRVEYSPPRPQPVHDLSRLSLDELRAFRDLMGKIEQPAASDTDAPLLIEQQPADDTEPQP